MTQDVHFSLLTHTKQVLLVTFCYTTAENGASFWTHGQMDGRTDGQTEVEVEIVVLISNFKVY